MGGRERILAGTWGYRNAEAGEAEAGLAAVTGAEPGGQHVEFLGPVMLGHSCGHRGDDGLPDRGDVVEHDGVGEPGGVSLCGAVDAPDQGVVG